MDFLDFFTEDIEINVENPKMTCSEFVEKTKKLLHEIESGYWKCIKSKQVPEKHYKSKKCDNCTTGQCTIKIKGIEYDCYADRENGECCYNYFDNEELENLMLDIINENPESEFQNLIYAEIVDNAE